MTAPQRPLSTSQAAAQLGVPQWKVRRVVDRIAPELPRVGLQGVRSIPPAMLKALAEELRADGYVVKTT